MLVLWTVLEPSASCACSARSRQAVKARRVPDGAGSLQVLGIIGALDPHTHKTNQADLQGEGKLEREGVRPQRQHHSAGGPQDDALGALSQSGCHTLSFEV